MNKRKFFYLISIIIFSYLFINIIVNHFIDPYMEFKNDLFKYHYKHSAESAVLLSEKLKQSKYNLVFGTSRTHHISDNDLKYPTLNLHSIYGTPYAALDFIKSLDQNQLNNINNIYFELSDITYDGLNKYIYINYNNYLYNYIAIIKKTNLNKIIDSFFTIKNNYHNNSSVYINNNGSLIFLKELPIYDKNIPGMLDSRRVIVNRQKYQNESFIKLKEFHLYVKNLGITIYYLMAPVHIDYYENSNKEIIKEMTTKFHESVGCFHNLFITKISHENKYFSDANHTNNLGKNYLLDNIQKNSYLKCE
jgi:hypothetical protein